MITRKDCEIRPMYIPKIEAIHEGRYRSKNVISSLYIANLLNIDHRELKKYINNLYRGKTKSIIIQFYMNNRKTVFPPSAYYLNENSIELLTISCALNYKSNIIIVEDNNVDALLNKICIVKQLVTKINVANFFNFRNYFRITKINKDNKLILVNFYDNSTVVTDIRNISIISNKIQEHNWYKDSLSKHRKDKRVINIDNIISKIEYKTIVNISITKELLGKNIPKRDKVYWAYFYMFRCGVHIKKPDIISLDYQDCNSIEKIFYLEQSGEEALFELKVPFNYWKTYYRYGIPMADNVEHSPINKLYRVFREYLFDKEGIDIHKLSKL